MLFTQPQAEETSVGYTLHRPIAKLSVSVESGKSLLSRDLGIPGKTSCHIFWDPLRSADEKSRSSIAKIDKSVESQHEIGYTGAIYSSEPKWDHMYESTESRRLKQLLPSDGNFFEQGAEGPDIKELTFPLLQPFVVKSGRKDSAGRLLDCTLKEWSSVLVGNRVLTCFGKSCRGCS